MNFTDICKRLNDSGIENSEQEAALLLEKFCGVTPSSLPIRKNEDFKAPQLDEALEKRCDGYPIQYILGEWYFYGERYIVNENCLIPRSDTEILVEKAIELLPPNAVFADLCTGSGCIAISVLAHRPDCRAYAIELYEDTLALAAENAALNGVSDRFIPVKADVLKQFDLEIFRTGSSTVNAYVSDFGGASPILDALISNPPYIRSDVVPTLKRELSYEPQAALDGGGDGLDFYRAILEKHLPLLKKDGFVAFEIGYDQGRDMTELAEKHSLKCDIIKDLSANDRVAVLLREAL